MTPNPYNWSTFSISFYYPLALEDTFTYWSTKKGLESFFIEKAIVKSKDEVFRGDTETFQKGDTYTFFWRHNFSVSGTFTEVIQNKLVTLSFGSMEVSLIFKPRGEKTLVYLKQSKISLDEGGRVMGHLNCRSCWVFFMANLKSFILTGTDLRDNEPEIVSSMEVGFDPVELR